MATCVQALASEAGRRFGNTGPDNQHYHFHPILDFHKLP